MSDCAIIDSMYDVFAKLNSRKAIYLILFIGSLVYFNALFNGFVWDDEEQIVKNSVIQNLANFPQIFSGATFNTGGAGLSGWFFRPLLTFAYMVNYTFWGQNPFGYHLFQIALHLLNGILLFKILAELTKNYTRRYTILINMLAAVTYVVHPVNVEAVSYIASLHFVMMVFFTLSALYLILKHKKREGFNLSLGFTVTTLLFLGVLSNELAASGFVLIAFFSLLFKYPQKTKWILGLLSVLALYFLLRLVALRALLRSLSFSQISEASLLSRVLTIPMELFSYLHLIFFPDKLTISRQFVISSSGLLTFFLPLLIVSLFFGALLFWARNIKSKPVFYGVVWFLLGFAAVSNIIPLDATVAERWLYFPLIGFIVILAETASSLLPESPPGRSLFFVVWLLVILALGIRTTTRNGNWHDGLTLYSHDIKISQNSFELENNFGVELFRNGKIEDSKYHFQRSILLQPKWAFPYNNLGAVYEAEKDYDMAAKLYGQALQRSDYYLAYENLAQLLLFHKNPKDARDFTQKALHKLPQNPKLWLTLALADYKLNNLGEALKEAQRSYQLSPTKESLYVLSILQNGTPIKF